MRQSKAFMKIAALFIGVVLTVADPLSAMSVSAAEGDAAGIAEATEVVSEDVTGEYTGAEGEESEETMLSEGALEALMSGSEGKESESQLTEAIPEDTDSAGAAAVDEELLKRLEPDVDPIIENLGAKEIVSADYTVTRYASRISIKNNAEVTEQADETANGSPDDLYAALVYKDNGEESSKTYKGYIDGKRITPGSEASLFFVYDKSGTRKELDETSEYTLLLSRADEYTTETEEGSEEAPETEIFEFAIFDYESAAIKADVTSEITPETGTEWIDGYGEKGVKMKALLQKNKTLKITWAPNTKDETQKLFKKYALYELTEDPSEPTGYKETKRWPEKGETSGSKSATLKLNYEKERNVYDSSLIYLLKCFDKEGVQKASYVTVAAPYLIQMQSGYSTGDFDFFFTQPRTNSDAIYKLQIAEKNKEYDPVKVPLGFQDAWTVGVGGDELDGYSVGDYFLSKTLMPTSVQVPYSAEEPVVTVNKTYYGRVSTVCFINGLKVTSAPSNVMSCKAGPDKCFVIDVAGVKYDPKDKDGNKDRASAHMSWYMGQSEENPEIYIHESNHSTCVKSGMVFFIAPDDISNIKAFDLLRYEYENGNYKKIKSYTLSEKTVPLIKCNVEDMGLNVYALWFNGFQPEKKFYYAVRAVSKTGNAPGGRGAGYENITELDKVGGLATVDAGSQKISLSWAHDDCVKQYWIYRSENKNLSTAELKSAGEYGAQLIAKVSGGSVKKYTYDVEKSDGTTGKETIRYHLYNDTKVKNDTRYYYYVRPVYNTTTAAKDTTYNMSKCSQVIMGKASALYAQIGGFKASNYAATQIQLKFNQVKGLTQYRIWRLEVDSNATKLNDTMKPDIYTLYNESGIEDYEQFEDYVNSMPLTEWETFFDRFRYNNNGWKLVTTVQGNSNSSATKTVIDNTAEIGHYYYYMIQGATDQSSGINFSYTGRVRNMPLAVTDAKVGYSGSGTNLNVSYSLNSKDKGVSGLQVKVSIDGGSWIAVNNSGFSDTVTRGRERTYVLAVFYGDVKSSEVKLTYSLPSGIDINKSGGDGTYSNATLGLQLGQIANMSARAYKSDGGTAAYNMLDVEAVDTDVIKVTQNNNSGTSFSIEAIKTGTAKVRIKSAGIYRYITVRVTKAN